MKANEISLKAERDARKALANAKDALERALRELDRLTDQFEQAKSAQDKARVMSWVLNSLACNVMPNLGLNLIADAQAELMRASAEAHS